jgi:hypothetical protein
MARRAVEPITGSFGQQGDDVPGFAAALSVNADAAADT